jgi:hypothetical protein
MSRTIGLTIFFFLKAAAWGQEPREVLPQPREVPPDQVLPRPRLTPQIFMPLPEPLPERGRMSGWELYGVDSRGRFVPRVIYSPYGAYYYANGRPYPWTTSRHLMYMNKMVN